MQAALCARTVSWTGAMGSGRVMEVGQRASRGPDLEGPREHLGFPLDEIESIRGF